MFSSSLATMFTPRTFIICTLLASLARCQYQAQVTPFVHHHQQQQQYGQQPRGRYPGQVPASVHGPGVVRGHADQGTCQLDHVEAGGEVCVPTFTTHCDKEQTAGGVIIKHHDQCYDVTKTVCTEQHDIEDMEVCATSFSAVVVEAEAKLVTAEWVEACHDTAECVPAPPTHGYHAPSCRQVIR